MRAIMQRLHWFERPITQARLIIKQESSTFKYKFVHRPVVACKPVRCLARNYVMQFLLRRNEERVKSAYVQLFGLPHPREPCKVFPLSQVAGNGSTKFNDGRTHP